MAMIVVDGERFAYSVRMTEGVPSIDYDWLSGPNPGYGFSSSSAGPVLPTVAEATASIRDFLAQIDPATGFID